MVWFRDSKLRLGAVLVVAMVLTPRLGATASLPPLSVESRIYDERVIALVKLQYEMCAREKQGYLDLQADPSPHAAHTYKSVKKNIENSRKGYSLDAPIAPEPDWSNTMTGRVDEYFDGDRYAKYLTFIKHHIHMDGTCALETTEKKRAHITKEGFRYELDLDKERVQKFQARVSYDVLAAEEQPTEGQVCAMVEYLLSEPPVGVAPGSGVGCKLPNTKIEDPLEYITVKHVAGELCDQYRLKGTNDIKICLWQPLHYYKPPTLKTVRPVVLQVLHEAPNGMIYRKEAVNVETKAIPESIFTVPKDFEIQE